MEDLECGGDPASQMALMSQLVQDEDVSCNALTSCCSPLLGGSIFIHSWLEAPLIAISGMVTLEDDIRRQLRMRMRAAGALT